MARAAIFDRFGAPTSVVRCAHAPVPAPTRGKVIVALEAAPIHPADLMLIEGRYAFRPPLPTAPIGTEGVGRVVEVTEDTAAWLGRRVLLPMSSGTWRDRLLVSTRGLTAVPEDASAEHLALATVNPTAAWVLLHHMLHLRPGEWVLQNAGNSSVGLLIAQFAKQLGLRTISLTRSATGERAVRQAGGHVALVAHDEVHRVLRDYTGGAHIRLALDAVGGRATERLARGLAEGGTLVTYGSLSGIPCELDSSHLVFRDIRLRGFWLTGWFRQTSPDEREAVMQPLRSAASQGDLDLRIAATYPLDRISEALDHATRPGRQGKILLTGEAYQGPA
jgi:NADPH:quinone reductase-like Zn-dependent oxidoreductase